jgi:hypothetical protein
MNYEVLPPEEFSLIAVWKLEQRRVHQPSRSMSSWFSRSDASNCSAAFIANFRLSFVHLDSTSDFDMLSFDAGEWWRF